MIDTDPYRELNHTILPAVVRPEANFLNFPFFALSRKGLKGKIETAYRFVEERGGQKAELLWLVNPSIKYGHPTPFDRRVYHAINAVIYETIERKGYPLENPIQFSIYHLAGLMRFRTSGGKIYRNIKEALLRIKFTGVESKGSFYLKDKRRWIHDAFNLYDKVRFRGDELDGGTITETNYLWLGDFCLRNINAQYVRPLDYVFLASLKNDIAGRLYEVLSGKFYGVKAKQDYWFTEYHKLCEILPITPQSYLSDAKYKLKRAHDELIGTEFLSRVEWREGKQDFVVIYYLGERAKRERRGEFPKQSTLSSVEQQLLPFVKEPNESIQLSELGQQLHERGISRAVTMRLCQKYPEELIREKIAMHDEMKAAGELTENAAGYLRSAIEDDYKLSEEQERKIKARLKRKEQEDCRQHVARLEEVRKGIEEMRSIARDNMISKVISENPKAIAVAAEKITETHTQARMKEYGSAHEAYQESPMFRFAIQRILREEIYKERFDEAEKLMNERIAAIEKQIEELKAK